MCLQLFKYLVNQLFVSLFVLLFRFFIEGLCVYGDVVHVYRQPSLSHFRSEDFIHHCLKRCRGICESKEHYKGFEEALGC